MTELRTPRLRLIRATPAHLRAELESGDAFRAAIGVDVAPSWPPELYDRDAIRWTLAWLEANPGDTRWGFYYVVEAHPPMVIGAGGYKGCRTILARSRSATGSCPSVGVAATRGRRSTAGSGTRSLTHA